MHDDLIDAGGLGGAAGASPTRRRWPIYGGSYGGYAALAGVHLHTRDLRLRGGHRGPSNLTTLVHAIPPYWKPLRAVFDVRMGNVDDPKDADLIKNASPLFRADRIKRPLLIGQGANDPRSTRRSRSRSSPPSRRTAGKVTYVVYSDEGHGFARPGEPDRLQLPGRGLPGTLPGRPRRAHDR
jgi:dipeptidyl aminopeptidase/acylaminoacyl peptidase